MKLVENYKVRQMITMEAGSVPAPPYPVFQKIVVYRKVPSCTFRRGFKGSARREEVRGDIETDGKGEVLRLLDFEYNFVQQNKEEWKEDELNAVYNFLVEYGWGVTATLAIQEKLTPLGVLVEGCAFKLAYFAAFDDESITTIKDFIDKVKENYEGSDGKGGLKSEFRRKYAQVSDMESLKKVLTASPPEGLGFKDINDV